MTEKNNKINQYEGRMPINRVVKTFKKFNAYDRAKECKNKKLYDYDENEELAEHESE